MKRSIPTLPALLAAAVSLSLTCFPLLDVSAAGKSPRDSGAMGPVPKAVCGPNDHPETGLQGQVPAVLRMQGFQGFNCNLELVAQSRGDGANWQSDEYKQRHGSKVEHVCAYYGTAATTANRTHVGVPVVDITNAANPTPTAYLTTTSMLDPWESLKVNERRQLLAADNGRNAAGGPFVDIYDLSNDCRSPQLLASVPVGTGTDGGPVAPILGHEGSWAPDGLTYYGGDIRTGGGQYYAVDVADPTAPKLITTWQTGIASVHGMSISDDGTRGYFVSKTRSGTTGPSLTDPSQPANNGLLITDLSEIQARVPNAQVKLISALLWKDGSFAQMTIPIRIEGKPYLVFVDEGGAGGLSSASQLEAACSAGLSPFPMARIIDISDEQHPRVVSKLMLEVHDPANCSTVIPDLVGLSSFTYGSHYCSVDNKKKATTLACGYFNSGIRVFDIRDPVHPREIAYYNPAGTTTSSPGSNHLTFGQWRAGGPDWCSAQVHLDADNGTLWTTCQDNGLLMLRFTNGVWPFPQSKTPPGEQN